MFKRTAKRNIPVQIIIAQNPFAARPYEAIANAVTELQDITAKLRVVTFQQLDLLQNGRNKQALIEAYQIRNVLWNCQNCRDLISAVVEKRADDKSALKSRQKYAKLTKGCADIGKNAEFSIQIMNNMIDQYKTLHMKSGIPIITRIAATTTITIGSYGLANVVLPDDKVIPKIVLASVAVTAVPIGFYDAIAATFSKAKNIFKRCPKEIPYYVAAEERIGQILLGFDAGRTENPDAHTSRAKTEAAKKVRKPAP